RVSRAGGGSSRGRRCSFRPSTRAKPGPSRSSTRTNPPRPPRSGYSSVRATPTRGTTRAPSPGFTGRPGQGRVASCKCFDESPSAGLRTHRVVPFFPPPVRSDMFRVLLNAARLLVALALGLVPAVALAGPKPSPWNSAVLKFDRLGGKLSVTVDKKTKQR